MKNIICCVILLIVSFMIQSCSMEDSFLGTTTNEENNFPVHVEEYAKAVANEIHVTVQNLNNMRVDYSKADNSPAFKKQFYKDWYNASQTMTKSSISIEQMQIDPTVFSDKIRNLTSLQIEFIEKIIDECQRSKSNEDLLNRLISVTKEIHSSVPEIQQERLLRVTAVLYYCIIEINNLEKQGIMLVTPYNKYARIKTKSEGGSFGDKCRSFLAATWAIAVGEPTFAGEIVASVATVIVAGILMYEVVVCKKNYTDDTYQYCQEQFRKCIPSFYDACAHCLQFCLSYGDWPGSSKGCN